MKHTLLKSILICSFVLGASLSSYAQDYDDQLLIFRNTGEVNLLYQSSIDSITFTNTDTLGQWHNEPFMQVFHTPDTTLYVAISEIDSVCLGNRNEVEFKSDVRVLDDNDLLWIASTVDNTILYKLNTPDSYLPQKGDKLFYGSSDELFPIGLCAKVDKVDKKTDCYEVTVSSLDFTEVFNKFFYAGDISDDVEITNHAIRRAPHSISAHFDQEFTLNAEGIGSISGKINIKAKGPVVIRPLLHRYSALITLENDISCDIDLECIESKKLEGNSPAINIPLGRVLAVFIPSIDLSMFFELNASLKFKYHQDWGNKVILDWKREEGNNSFNLIEPSPNGFRKGEALCEVVFDGDLFCGGQIDFNFNLTGDIIGAKASLRLGPHFEAEISAGALLDLGKWHYNDHWNPSLYAKGDLSFNIQGTLDFYEIHREALIWGNKKETRLGGAQINICDATLHLFPEFDGTKAIEQRKETDANVSISTTTETSIEYPVEVGFQLIDVNQDLIVDSIFVGDIESNNQTEQGIAADIEINNAIIAKDTLMVRPIFHYAGYTIPYKPVSVSDNAPIQSVISYGNTSSVYYVSGTPIVGTFKNDSITFHVGPYVPVGRNKSNVFSTFSTYIYANSKDYNHSGHTPINYDLTGTWRSNNENKPLALTFNEDNTGILMESDSVSRSFTYKINKPSKQYVSLYTQDETIVFKVMSVEDGTITIFYRNHHESSKYVLTKQND